MRGEGSEREDGEREEAVGETEREKGEGEGERESVKRHDGNQCVYHKTLMQ